ARWYPASRRARVALAPRQQDQVFASAARNHRPRLAGRSDRVDLFRRADPFYGISVLLRNRSTCGVRPYIRATCNPDADCWVCEFLAWWIDPETGLPIPARAGSREGSLGPIGRKT